MTVPNYQSTLSPTEQESYARRRRQATQQYGRGIAGLEFQRGQIGADYQKQFRNVGQQFDQQRKQIPGSFINRGLANSGLYQNALKQYAQFRGQAVGDLYGQQQQDYAGLDLQRRQLEEVYSQTQADILQQEKARRAELAALIREIT